MKRTLTQEYSDRLAELLIRMGVEKEVCLEVLTAIETPEELKYFLDILSEKNYEMTSQEVYQAALDTTVAFQTA